MSAESAQHRALRIEASAPGRCGLVGNPSDMYSGCVVSCSMQERAYCTIDLTIGRKTISLGSASAEITSAADLAPDGGELDLLKAAISACISNLYTLPGFHLRAWSDIPRQSGLAGSTALLAAVIGALLRLMDDRRDPYSTAEIVRACEFDRMKTLCGFQDAYMSVFGGLQAMDFAGKTVIGNDPISPFPIMEPLQERIPQFPELLVAFTGVRHHSGQTHASLYERYCAGDPAASEAAQQFASLGRCAKRALVLGDWNALASLMTRNQELIRSVQPQNPANERLIQAALGEGAMAAKLAGAGGGGSILALTDVRSRQNVMDALISAGAAAVLVPRPSPGLAVEETN